MQITKFARHLNGNNLRTPLGRGQCTRLSLVCNLRSRSLHSFFVFVLWQPSTVAKEVDLSTCIEKVLGSSIDLVTDCHNLCIS
jgi:hypothetical protein